MTYLTFGLGKYSLYVNGDILNCGLTGSVALEEPATGGRSCARALEVLVVAPLELLERGCLAAELSGGRLFVRPEAVMGTSRFMSSSSLLEVDVCEMIALEYSLRLEVGCLSRMTMASDAGFFAATLLVVRRGRFSFTESCLPTTDKNMG